MDTAGALEHQELMSEGKDLRLQRCSSLKSLPSRRNQRENDREHVAEKLQRRLPKFNQFSQNGVFGRDSTTFVVLRLREQESKLGGTVVHATHVQADPKGELLAFDITNVEDKIVEAHATKDKLIFNIAESADQATSCNAS
jgi:hypothetical protein